MSEPSRWQKLKRGELHTKTLNDEISAYRASPDAHPIDLSSKFNSERKSWVVHITFVPALPDHWGVLAAEAVHNLRGALDHLVWDLALLNTGTIPLDKKGRTWRTQFPICTVPSNWESGGIADMVKPLSDDHVRRIEPRQPYNGWHASPRPHPLKTLEWLSNTDKHTTIQPVVATVNDLRMAARVVNVSRWYIHLVQRLPP